MVSGLLLPEAEAVERGVDLTPDGAATVARVSRGTPREARRLLERVLDHAASGDVGRIDGAGAAAALRALATTTIEPLLLRRGLIAITPRGRVAVRE
jgi:Holliday junction resolvasome RuvABC ATP-dependent DNA helicase subunit